MNEDKKIDDGGQAFPIPGFTDDPGNPGRTYCPIDGMSLRDYVAAKAMAGFAANPEYAANMDPQEMADEAAACADALIARLKMP